MTKKVFQYPSPLQKQPLSAQNSVSGRHMPIRSESAPRGYLSSLQGHATAETLPPGRRIDDGDDELTCHPTRPGLTRRSPMDESARRSVPSPKTSPSSSSPLSIPSPTIDRMESMRSFASQSTAAELDALCGGSRRSMYRNRRGDESIYSLGSERSLRSERSQVSFVRKSTKGRPEDPLASGFMDAVSVQSGKSSNSSSGGPSCDTDHAVHMDPTQMPQRVFVNAAEEEPPLIHTQPQLQQQHVSPPRKKAKNPWKTATAFFPFRRASMK